MAQPTYTQLGLGTLTTTPITFSAQPATSLLVLVIHRAGGTNATAFSGYAAQGWTPLTDLTPPSTNQSSWVFVKQSAGDTSVTLSSSGVGRYLLFALSDVDNVAAFNGSTTNPNPNPAIWGFDPVDFDITNNASAGERYFIGIACKHSSSATSITYTVDNGFTELLDSSMVLVSARYYGFGVFDKYDASASASQVESTTITPSTSGANLWGLVVEPVLIQVEDGTGSISITSPSLSSSGFKNAQGTWVNPELVVLTSDGIAQEGIAGTGSIAIDPVTCAGVGTKGGEGSGSITPVGTFSSNSGTKDTSGTVVIAGSVNLTSTGNKDTSGTGQLFISSVTFDTVEVKDGFGYGQLLIPEPEIFVFGGGEYAYSGTFDLNIDPPVFSTGIGFKTVLGTVLIPVASVLTSQGIAGDIVPGFRRWNGSSEDIVYLSVITVDGERPVVAELVE